MKLWLCRSFTKMKQDQIRLGKMREALLEQQLHAKGRICYYERILKITEGKYLEDSVDSLKQWFQEEIQRLKQRISVWNEELGSLSKVLVQVTDEIHNLNVIESLHLEIKSIDKVIFDLRKSGLLDGDERIDSLVATKIKVKFDIQEIHKRLKNF